MLTEFYSVKLAQNTCEFAIGKLVKFAKANDVGRHANAPLHILRSPRLERKNRNSVLHSCRERRLQAGKMLRWSILSESPSSYAAKASGSGLAGTGSRIRSTCKGASVEKGLAVQGKVAQTNRSAAKKVVQDWLSKLRK